MKPSRSIITRTNQLDPRSSCRITFNERYAQLFEYSVVSVTNKSVRFLSLLEVLVEGVEIFHDELASPQEAEAWLDFVPKLAGDLIEFQRQLFVRKRGQSGHQVGNGFLMGLSNAHESIESNR